jgi:uncharacterized protein involved in outer membrane biogenesis
LGETRLKRFITVIILLCVLSVAVLVVVPSFVDWNAYRGELSALLGRTAGRQVSIDGDLEMALLPSPHLNASDVRIANIEGASDSDMARVGEIRMQIAAGPLFGGRIAVTSLLLVEPVINLETLPDGRTNWDLAARPGQSVSGGQGEPPVQSALPLDFSFERVAIANGTLVWRGANGRSQKLERLNTQVAVADFSGPLKLEASANYGDIPFAVNLFVGQRDTGKPVPVNARITLADDVGEISISGALNRGSQTFEGKIGMSGADAAVFATAVAGKPVGGLPAWEFSAESPINATAKNFEAGDIALRLGELGATGRAVLGLGETPALKVRLDLATVNIDEILAQADQPSRAPDNASNDAPEPTAIPEGFDAEIDIRAAILRWKGSIVRDAGVIATLQSDVLTVERASAQFPGGTSVNLSGKVVDVDGGPRLVGDLAVISDNLRAALLWGGVEESTLPTDRLRAFSYTSRISIQSDTVNLTEIKARIDATNVSGAAVIARRARPSFGVNLDIDQIGLDAYLAAGDRGTAGSPDAANADQGTTGFGAFDANLNFAVQTLTWRDKRLSSLRIDAQLFNGDLDLRELTAGDLGGAAMAMSGKITSLVFEPSADISVSIDGRDPEAFAGFIGINNSAFAQRVGQFEIAGQATGTLDNVQIDAVMDVIGGKVAASGVLTGLDDRFALNLAMSVKHADGDPVLALALPGRRGGEVGPLEARFQLSGGADSLAFEDIFGKLGGTNFSGAIDVTLSGERPDVTADLATGVVLLDRLFPAKSEPPGTAGTPPVRGNARWSREPIDVTGLRDLDMSLVLRSDALVRRDVRVDEVLLRAAIKNGVATIEEFSGQLFGGVVKATGRLDATDSASAMGGTLSARDISSLAALEATGEFARLEGPVSVDVSLTATGHNEFELISSLSGNGQISGNVEARLKGDERAQAGVGTLLGALLGDKIREVGATGDAVGALIKAFAVEPSALSGDFVVDKGVARTDNLLLDGRGARALTAGTTDLANWWIDSTTDMHRNEDTDEPYVTVGLKGPLDTPDVRTAGIWLKRPPEPAPQQPNPEPAGTPESVPEKPQNPEDFIRDILKSIQ